MTRDITFGPSLMTDLTLKQVGLVLELTGQPDRGLFVRVVRPDDHNVCDRLNARGPVRDG